MFPLLWQYKDEVKTMAQAFFGGVHPNDMKAATNEKAIEQLQAPAQVVIPMSMHFGAPCTPTVSKGDYVKLGQKIGEFKGLGAPIHASVSGTVAAVEPRPYSMGGKVMSVVIDNDFKDDLSEEVHAPADPDALSVEEMVEMVKQAGIVGMGGATFPTHTKISSGIGKVDTVIINGAECEPYITSDYRQMMEHSERVIDGVFRTIEALEIPAAVIGVEDNKPEAILELKRVVKEKGREDRIEVMEIPTKYPAGGEKVLIKATTGRDVPAGGLPIDAGCLVVNVTTISRVEQYFRYGMPLTCKTVTVTGDCIANPGNYRIPLGMSVRDVIEATGGMVKEPKKIIMGGPMMGRTITNIDCPILKANNAIVALHDAAVLPDETACIRCALDSASRCHDVVALDELAVMNCMECGSCAYVCPAHRRITASIREGKAVYRGEVARLTAPSEKKEA